MKLTFLEALVPLTKSFTATTKSSYPSAYEFTSHTHDVTTLQDFELHLRAHAAQGHCLLKGEIQRQLQTESRAGSTDPTTPTEWMCFDFDGASSLQVITDYLDLLGSPDYILQYSASHGVTGQSTDTKAHVFVLLSKPASPALLKLWARWQNVTHTELRAHSRLTKTAAALSYLLDPTVMQNDKLIYITAPECDPPSLDTVTNRISLHTGLIRALDPDALLSLTPPEATVRSLTETRINELRSAANIGPRKSFNYRIDKATGTEYLDKADPATVTSHKTDRGFVYLNLNGGDSWGYYYPETDNTFVFNFKDEPVYKLEQLSPSFYKASLPAAKAAAKAAQQAQAQQASASHATQLAASTAPTATSLVFIGFRDRVSTLYYQATYDPTAQIWLSIDRAASEKQLADFLIQNGQPSPDVIPIWDLVFDPNAPALDIPNRRINHFTPTQYLTNAAQRVAAGNVPVNPPPTITAVIHHALGGDQATYDHFINWLRYVIQHRKASGTAWVLHGVQGTGKGVLANSILRPMLGLRNTHYMQSSQLQEKYNEGFENSFLTVIDEMSIKDLEGSSRIMNQLKAYITEPQFAVRKMRTAPYLVDNHNNFLMFSNNHEQIILEESDRRHNIGVYQTAPLLTKVSRQDIKTLIPNEIEDFATWLMALPADADLASTVIKNQARIDMMDVSSNSIDTCAKYLLEGNLEELHSMRIPHTLVTAMQAETASKYDRLIEDIIVHDLTHLRREQIILIFEHCVGLDTKTMTPIKATKFLAHHNIKIRPMRVHGVLTKGFVVNWNADPAWLQEQKDEISVKRKAAEASIKK
jgi:hypothetical protein